MPVVINKTIKMGVYQIIYLVLVIANLMTASYLHGKPKEGKHNIWITIVSAAITLFLLYNGGFFK